MLLGYLNNCHVLWAANTAECVLMCHPPDSLLNNTLKTKSIWKPTGVAESQPFLSVSYPHSCVHLNSFLHYQTGCKKIKNLYQLLTEDPCDWKESLPAVLARTNRELGLCRLLNCPVSILNTSEICPKVIVFFAVMYISTCVIFFIGNRRFNDTDPVCSRVVGTSFSSHRTVPR